MKKSFHACKKKELLMFKAKIYVTYKPSVLDPKAEVIKTAL
ncbi:phosphoribosylformylglycinamidine synthase subunit PurS, partial [Lacticaseibacillus paracasei]